MMFIKKCSLPFLKTWGWKELELKFDQQYWNAKLSMPDTMWYFFFQREFHQLKLRWITWLWKSLAQSEHTLGQEGRKCDLLLTFNPKFPSSVLKYKEKSGNYFPNFSAVKVKPSRFLKPKSFSKWFYKY